MKIIVMIKQVPGTSNVEVDPKTGVLKRDGVESKLNPYDLYAIEQALRIREQLGGEVQVITMGPPQAKAAVLEAIYMGADSGCVVSDRRFAGADVLSTSYTLSQGIKKLGKPDLILCGKQTTDGDTAQVGPEAAEFLHIPHATNVVKILNIDEKAITVKINMDTSEQVLHMPLPCLLTVDKGINTPRLPSYKRKYTLEGELVSFLSLDDFEDKDEKRYGLMGSPTKVEKIFPPEKNMDKEIFQGDDGELAEKLYHVLRTRKFV